MRKKSPLLFQQLLSKMPVIRWFRTPALEDGSAKFVLKKLREASSLTIDTIKTETCFYVDVADNTNGT